MLVQELLSLVVVYPIGGILLAWNSREVGKVI